MLGKEFSSGSAASGAGVMQHPIPVQVELNKVWKEHVQRKKSSVMDL